MSKSSLRFRDKVSAYLELIRLYFTIEGVISFSGAVVAARGLPSPWILFVTLFAPMLGGYAAGVANDYFDREVDKHEKPYRPIPSGRVKPVNALILACVLAFSGIALTLTLRPICWLLAVGVFLAGLSYNFIRSARFVGSIFRGLTDAFCISYGYAAVSGLTLELAPLASILFFDTLSSNILSSVKDVSGDKAGGLVTFSVLLGPRKAVKLGFTLFLLTIVIGLMIYATRILGILFLGAFLATRAPMFWVFSRLMKSPSPFFGRFALATHLFSRVCSALSFTVGVLPSSSAVVLAISLSLLSLVAAALYYSYVIVETR